MDHGFTYRLTCRPIRVDDYAGL